MGTLINNFNNLFNKFNNLYLKSESFKKSLLFLFIFFMILSHGTLYAYYGSPYGGGLAGGLSGGLFGSQDNSLGGLGGLYGGPGIYNNGLSGGLANVPGGLSSFNSIMYPPPPLPQQAVLSAARAYLSDPGLTPVITANALYELLNDGDPANDPLIISVRKPEDYMKGHIPGAINIPCRNIADPGNLLLLPKNRLIVTYCYTGHTGAIAATILNLLGYKALNLKFGIMSWTTDPIVRTNAPFIEGIDSHNFPLNPGPNP